MLTLVRSSQFKRDVKRAKLRGKDLAKLRMLLNTLIDEEPLPPHFRDHQLRGIWSGYREAHIEPDWLLIYKIHAGELYLVRTGTHADLFSS